MPILTPEQICERLRAIRGYRVCDCKVDEPINPDGPEAADRIEQQQATIERLSAALEKIDEWCCPMLCDNCRDNRRAARNALGKDAK